MARTTTNRSRSKTRRSRPRSGSYAKRRSSSASTSATGWTRHGTALPGWGDLAPEKNKRTTKSSGNFFERISTVRFALLILVLAAVFTLYVGHVHATQDLLAKLQEARRVNQSLHLKHNRLKGAFDRATGPAVIHERAQELGLRESLTYGPSIEVDTE